VVGYSLLSCQKTFEFCLVKFLKKITEQKCSLLRKAEGRGQQSLFISAQRIFCKAAKSGEKVAVIGYSLSG
jgi:hypothetical protein